MSASNQFFQEKKYLLKKLFYIIWLRFGLAAMVEFGNGGRFVNTASLAGIGAAGAKVGSAHYSAAKVSLDFVQFNKFY